MFLPGERSGHRYLYLPSSDSLETSKRPVIVFLHGSLGNFKGYLWTLKPLADRLGVGIVAPTFGAGEWRTEKGLRTILETITWCRSQPSFDSDKIILLGISNGGGGITHALDSLESDSIAGLVYLSPVMDPEKISAKHLSDTPALVISGTNDRRVSHAYVSQGAQALEESGISIRLEFVEAEDHFLLFSQPEAVRTILAKWLESNGLN